MKAVPYLLLATLVAPALWANSDDEAPRFSERTTVSARATASEAAATDALAQEDSSLSSAVSVAEAIADFSGLHLLTSGARGGQSAVLVRGGDPNFTLVLLDGVPLNDSTDQLGGAINLDRLPASGFEQVELAKGPLSSFLGSTALGGVLNLVTKAPTGAPSHSARFAVGDADLVVGALGTRGQGDAWSFSLSGGLDRESERIAEESFDSAHFFGSVSRYFDKGRVRLAVSAQDWEIEDYSDGSGGPVLGDGALRSSAHSERTSFLNWQWGTGAVEHEFGASLLVRGLKRNNPSIGSTVPPIAEDTDFDRSSIAWSSRFALSSTVNLLVGAQRVREEGSNQGLLAGFLDTSYAIDRTTTAAFVELIARGENTTVELGLRGDDPEDLDTEWSLRLASSHRLSETWRLRASAARAFKLPSFYALASPAAVGGNPELMPETSEGYDLAFEHTSQSQTFSLGAFHTEYQDLIDFLFEPVFGLFNRDQVEAQGIELRWRRSLDDAWTLATSWTLQDVEDSRTGNELRHRPAQRGNVRLDWEPTGRLRAGAIWTYVSGFRDQQLVSLRERVDGHNRLALTAAWQVDPSWTLDLRVGNVADEAYEVGIGFPGAKRSMRVGVRYRAAKSE